MNFIIFGFKSSGKTYFGKLLAKELNLPFIDTDECLEKLFFEKFKKKKNCREITLEIGYKGFQNLEKEVIENLNHLTNSVVALGGGTLLVEDNFKILRKIGKLLYLDVEKEILKKRIFSEGIPAFLDKSNPEISFEKIFEERIKKYEQINAVKISTFNKSDLEILEELKQGCI